MSRQRGIALGLDRSSMAMSGQSIASSVEKQQDMHYHLCRALAQSGESWFLWQDMGQDSLELCGCMV